MDVKLQNATTPAAKVQINAGASSSSGSELPIPSPNDSASVAPLSQSLKKRHPTTSSSSSSSSVSSTTERDSKRCKTEITIDNNNAANIDQLKVTNTPSLDTLDDKPESILTWNIGGTIFQCYPSTLLRFPETMLGRMFCQGNKALVQDRTTFFFDRDPDIFTEVLRYYRSGIGPNLKALALKCGRGIDFICFELEYWGLINRFIAEPKSTTDNNGVTIKDLPLRVSKFLQGLLRSQTFKKVVKKGDRSYRFYPQRKDHTILYGKLVEDERDCFSFEAFEFPIHIFGGKDRDSERDKEILKLNVDDLHPVLEELYASIYFKWHKNGTLGSSTKIKASLWKKTLTRFETMDFGDELFGLEQGRRLAVEWLATVGISGEWHFDSFPCLADKNHAPSFESLLCHYPIEFDHGGLGFADGCIPHFYPLAYDCSDCKKPNLHYDGYCHDSAPTVIKLWRLQMDW